jgi:hypothetical protein
LTYGRVIHVATPAALTTHSQEHTVTADTSTSTALLVAEPVVEGTIFEGTVPTPEPEADQSTEARIAALKTIWAKGTEDEKEALFNLGSARVLKARVAYMAGALGSKTGTPNNKAAMRILDLAQNTVRPYFLAGVALAEAGWDGRVTAPTQEEIDLVSPIISKAQKGTTAPKAPKAESTPAGGTDTESDADTEGSGTRSTKGAEGEPVIQADVIAAVEALQLVVAQFTRDQGFSAVVADNLAEVLAEIGATIDSHRVDGGDA